MVRNINPDGMKLQNLSVKLQSNGVNPTLRVNQFDRCENY